MTKLEIHILDDARVEVQADTPQQLIKEVAFWHSLPLDCPVCRCQLRLTFRNPTSKKDGKKYDYYGLRCVGTPAHETTFGIHQEKADGLFYKESEEWTLARRGGEVEPEEPAPAPDARPFITVGQVAKICDRLMNGEDILQQTFDNFRVSASQRAQLEKAAARRAA